MIVWRQSSSVAAWSRGKRVWEAMGKGPEETHRASIPTVIIWQGCTCVGCKASRTLSTHNVLYVNYTSIKVTLKEK